MVEGNYIPSIHFPLICLKNYINRLHEVGETTRKGKTTRGGLYLTKTNEKERRAIFEDVSENICIIK